MTVPMSNWNPLVMEFGRIVLPFVTVLRCIVGLILTQKIIPDLSHGREGVHRKIGEITSRGLAFPHTLARSKLLYQALIICVNKYGSILYIVIIQQTVNLFDGLGTKLDPLASDEDGGVDLERHIGVELPHGQGHSGYRGCTERLPTTVLDSEVEERIGGGETAF